MAITKETIRAARRHLRQNDAVMRAMIDEVGPFTLRPHRDRFGMLVRSIISQQISVGAARTIRSRLEQLVAPAKVTPASLLRYDVDQLRGVGVSRQKATYILNLAEKTHDDTVPLRTMGRLSDEDVIGQLTQVKGIGRWTAHMFLIFALGRLDVFPYDDLGVKVAIRDRYGLAEIPDKPTSLGIAQRWHPYASVASWYCWRTIDLGRQRK